MIIRFNLIVRNNFLECNWGEIDGEYFLIKLLNLAIENDNYKTILNRMRITMLKYQ